MKAIKVEKEKLRKVEKKLRLLLKHMKPRSVCGTYVPSIIKIGTRSRKHCHVYVPNVICHFTSFSSFFCVNHFQHIFFSTHMAIIIAAAATSSSESIFVRK